MVVIDEQHRFGVEQRAALRDKGRDAADGDGADPDVLVMTATPIPRTAAMIVFGDLDMTVLDELPAGRTPVDDAAGPAPKRDEKAAWERVRDEVAAGHRAYVVCPLVDESERVQAKSATEERDRLAVDGRCRACASGCSTASCKAAEKEARHGRASARGELEVLVATTVIEVGVDVPDATVMVIEDADRFGIAQLHQLRGRVGRADRAVVVLPALGTPSTPDGGQRLEALGAHATTASSWPRSTSSCGARGRSSGTRQKGRSDLKLASLRAATGPWSERPGASPSGSGRRPGARGDQSWPRSCGVRGRGEAAFLLKS